MMLQALIAYAEREGLGDPDFESVNVRWLIPLDTSGELTAGPIPLAENPDDKKPRPKALVRPFTSANDLNQGTKSHFLCDTLERSTLMLDPNAADKAEARRTQHAYLKSLFQEAAISCPSESTRLQAVIRFLENPPALQSLHDKLLVARAKPSDNAIFAVDGEILLDREPLRQFWRDRRQHSAASSTRSRRICLATGLLAETLDTTEKIKGVPGGLAIGTNLISFDKDSFSSFGLEQAQNAALSAPAELKLRSALNRLIEISRGQRLVINNAIHLHWTRQPVEFDPLDPVITGDPNGIERLLTSVQRGQPTAGVGLAANAYYALSLSGNGARIIVRDWLESTVPDVERQIAQWFEDLAIVPHEGIGRKRDFKFGALLYGMVRAELDELSPQLPTHLLHAALRGTPLPQTCLIAALRRQQLDEENKLHVARMALIKACLQRSPNRKETEPMTECLNPNSRDPAYLCGRLFAVFDRLQYLALGGVNAGVVDRFYASASNTPALVMGRLFRNAQFHLAKAEGGIAENVRKDFEQITCALGDQFPPALDLEAQGRFALGFYHQKAEHRRRSAERKEAATDSDNPNGKNTEP